MAELEKIKADEKIYNAFSNLQESTTNSLEKAYNAINRIDSAGSSTDK